MIKKIVKYIFNSDYRFLVNCSHNNIKNMSETKIIEKLYKINTGEEIDINNPRTFNEKLYYLKLFDRKDIYTQMADKYEAKKIIENTVGKEYVVNTIAIYDDINQINIDLLPERFVIKCTHDFASTFVCKDRKSFDINKVKKNIKKHLRRNLYFGGREWVYKNIKPRIIVEEYLDDGKNSSINDYKLFCFNGKVLFYKIDFDRDTIHKANYYNLNNELLNFREELYPNRVNVTSKEFPKNLETMIKIAEKLSKNTYFLRVDFYEINNRVYVGEMTFYPSAGFGSFEPKEADLILGNYLNIDELLNKTAIN